MTEDIVWTSEVYQTAVIDELAICAQVQYSLYFRQLWGPVRNRHLGEKGTFVKQDAIAFYEL